MPIEICDYDNGWPEAFAQICTRVGPVLDTLVLRIEHVGSTSVPGLAARPIIDLDVVIRQRSDLPAVIERLGTLDYVHQGDLGITGREAFRSVRYFDEPRHHLYVVGEDASELRRHLAFRDRLRADADVRERYAALKREVASRVGDDRAAYVSGKSAFVESVLTTIASA